MTAVPLAIQAGGLVCAVGLNAPAACAAIRCNVDNFQETRFIDAGGEWLIGATVPMDPPLRGVDKLTQMLVWVLQECQQTHPELDLKHVPLLLCLAEEDRPGREPKLQQRVFHGVEAALGVRFHPRSRTLAQGRVGGASALYQARKLIQEHSCPQVLVAGVDSLLNAQTLRSLEQQNRLLTSQHSDGFIPGEAAAAILVTGAAPQGPHLQCVGLGSALEPAPENTDAPLRADGLVQAIRTALAEAAWDLGAVDFRITDNSGSQYTFKESALALTRLLRERKEEFDLWHPAECVGEVGAAIGPVLFNVLVAATAKDYAPGHRVLCHVSGGDGKRVAMLFNFQRDGV